MIKRITKEIEVDASFCNICEKEIDKIPFNKKRIEMVKHIFNTTDFDAHEGCINEVVRESFKKYFKQ